MVAYAPPTRSDCSTHVIMGRTSPRPRIRPSARRAPSAGAHHGDSRDGPHAVPTHAHIRGHARGHRDFRVSRVPYHPPFLSQKFWGARRQSTLSPKSSAVRGIRHVIVFRFPDVITRGNGTAHSAHSRMVSTHQVARSNRAGGANWENRRSGGGRLSSTSTNSPTGDLLRIALLNGSSNDRAGEASAVAMAMPGRRHPEANG
jgi:hypothetical protein